MAEAIVSKDLGALNIGASREFPKNNDGDDIIIPGKDPNYNSPRHSTSLRIQNKEHAASIVGVMGLKSSTSSSISLEILGKKPATIKEKRLSNLNPKSNHSFSQLGKSNTAGSQAGSVENENKLSGKSECGELKKGKNHDSAEIKNSKSSEESSGISRLLKGFRQRSKVSSKLHDAEVSSSNPQMVNNRDTSKRERDLSVIPANAMPAKAPPGSNSAYDIRGKLDVQRPLCLEDYYLIRRVGKGGFATVFLVRLKGSTGRYYALKVMKKSEVVRLRQEKQIMNEKNILLELKHWLLVELYHTFQTPSHLFMIMEFVCGGDLFTLLRKSKALFRNSNFSSFLLKSKLNSIVRKYV